METQPLSAGAPGTRQGGMVQMPLFPFPNDRDSL